FFSSRRRHTRFSRDWSSDVCSSDLSQLVFQANPLGMTIQIIVMIIQNFITNTYGLLNSVSVHNKGTKALYEFLKMPMLYALILRSEERRVGKECRSRLSLDS